MKIAVCIKSVPDTETKIKLAGDSKNIDIADVRFITSPYDEFAIEEALKLKEKVGGETVAISIGGNEATEVLRDSLARGIDSAIHVKDAELENLDPLSTAKILAAVIRDGGYDVIFCGQQGVGGDNSAVPSMLAELLDIPQASMTVKLEIADNKFKAEREIEGAHETVEGTLPALFSAQKGLNEPRYPSIKGVMAARRKEIAVKDANAIGVAGTFSADKRKMRLKQMVMPAERPQGKLIDGDVDTQAKTLVKLLREEAHVI